MSYNPDTGRIRCDVCGSETVDRSYTTYQRTISSAVQHICTFCLNSGARWCYLCETIHVPPGKCPQLPLPTPGQEATNG